MIILKLSLIRFHYNTADENQAWPYSFTVVSQKRKQENILLLQGPGEENRIKAEK